MSDIFLSYASEDRERARQLADALTAEGWCVFWDRTIPTAEKWHSYIDRALDDARCVVVAWSAASVNSKWVLEEANEGLNRDIIVPVFFESIRPPLGFRLIQGANLAEWDGDKAVEPYRMLVEAVGKKLGASPRKPAATSSAPKSVPKPVPRPESAKPKSTPSRPVTTAVATDFAIFRDHLKDGSEGPEMIRIPAGQFRMGDLIGKGNDVEKPVHTVRIARPFAIGRYAVTFDEYDAYAQATRRPVPDDRGWGRGRRPVIMVSWDDAVAFCQWLSEQTGKCYRLPSEAEWEYAARAATETEYWWGNDIGSNRANCDGSGSEWSNKQTAPVGSFQPNPWGLYDTAGNVWEWVQDVWHFHYEGAPTDGSAWEIAPPVNAVSTSSVFGLFKRTPAVPEPGLRVMRGGSWVDGPGGLRSALRLGVSPDARVVILGFRLAQDL